MTGSADITWKITGKGAGRQCEHCPRRLATYLDRHLAGSR